MTGTTLADPTKMTPRAPTCCVGVGVVGVVGVARMESRLCRQTNSAIAAPNILSEIH